MTALDFSEVAVKRGLEMEPSVNWMVGDARRLDETFDEAAFGAIVDKGTIDAIYLSAGDSCTEDVGAVATGAARVLEPRGTFLCVSLSAPQYIWPLLQCDAWDIQQCEVRRLDGAFLYVMRRGRLKKKGLSTSTTNERYDDAMAGGNRCVPGGRCPYAHGRRRRGNGCRSAVSTGEKWAARVDSRRVTSCLWVYPVGSSGRRGVTSR